MTGVMDKAGCNIGESRAVKLGNHFSVMMLVSAPKEETTSSLTEQLKVIDGLTITTFETSDPKAIEVNPQTGCEWSWCLNKIMFSKCVQLDSLFSLVFNIYGIYALMTLYPCYIVS